MGNRSDGAGRAFPNSLKKVLKESMIFEKLILHLNCARPVPLFIVFSISTHALFLGVLIDLKRISTFELFAPLKRETAPLAAADGSRRSTPGAVYADASQSEFGPE